MISWIDCLNEEEKIMLNRIAGQLDLPNLWMYGNKINFLQDVLLRISEARSLVRQASKVLGE